MTKENKNNTQMTAKKKKLSLKAAAIVATVALTLASLTACPKTQTQTQAQTQTQEQSAQTQQSQPEQKEDIDAFLAQKYVDDPTLSDEQNNFYESSLVYIQAAAAIWEEKESDYDLTFAGVALRSCYKTAGYTEEEIKAITKKAMKVEGTYQEKYEYLKSFYPKEDKQAANDNSYTVVQSAENSLMVDDRQKVNE